MATWVPCSNGDEVWWLFVTPNSPYEGRACHCLLTSFFHVLTCLAAPQAVLRKAQSRCQALEGELAESQKQLKRQRKEEPACSAGRSTDSGASSTGAVQSRCDELAAELAAAKHQQLEAAAAAAAAVAESRELSHQVERLQQQLAAACQHATAAAGKESSPGGLPEAVPLADAALATLQQQLAERAAHVEQLEFEKAELLVKLEESERQLAAQSAPATSAAEQAGKDTQQIPAASAPAGKPSEPAVSRSAGDSCEAGWSLAAGHASAGADAAGINEQQEALQAVQRREAELQQQVQQLKNEVQELESKAAALKTTELRAAGAASNGAASVDAADLRRQLQERSQEVADLSALSIKADATVQQYMAQLRR